MPTLNLDIDYFSHPKVKRLVRVLGKGAELFPIRLWCYTARYFPDGTLRGVTADEIEAECGWAGEKGFMLQACLASGSMFIEHDGTDYCVHDWQEHEGHVEAYRERAKNAANARWNQFRAKNSDATSNATSNASGNAPAVRYGTVRNNTPIAPKGAEGGIQGNPGESKPDSSPPAAAAPPAIGPEAVDADGFLLRPATAEEKKEMAVAEKMASEMNLERFWKAYPQMGRSRSSKAKVQKAWKAGKCDRCVVEIEAGLRAWKQSEAWMKQDGQYVGGAHTWLNERRWENPPPPAREPDSDDGFVRAPMTFELLVAGYGLDVPFPDEFEAQRLAALAERDAKCPTR